MIRGDWNSINKKTKLHVKQEYFNTNFDFFWNETLAYITKHFQLNNIIYDLSFSSFFPQCIEW